MSIKKRCCSAMLAATMLSGIVTQASAVSTEVLFENNMSDGTDPIISEVVIPAQITLQMDKTGAVSVKEKDLKLSNTSQTSKATVKKISVVGKQGFSIADYSSDLESKPEGTKEVALQFNGDGTTSSGDVVLTSNWEIEPSNDKALTINAKMPKQPADFEVSGGIATINWEIDTEETGVTPDQSTIDNNWTKDKVLKTSVTPVIFSYDSTNPSTTLQSVESSNPDIVSITDAGAGASFGNEQTANYNVQALAVGRSTITATLSTGESTQFDVEVYELDIPGSSGGGTTGEIEVPEVPGKGDGDSIETGDVTIDIPITTPDGEDTITVTPEIPEDTVLGEGENKIEIDVEVDGVTIHITIVINIASSNPSNGLTQSVADAKAMGFTFSSYEDGLQIDSFKNEQVKSEINVPEQIGDFKVLKIGNNVFNGQTNIKKVTLPDTVTVIGDSAFAGCTNLQDIVISDSISSIGDEAFYECSNLRGHITLSKNIKKIGTKAFAYCGNYNLDLNIDRNIGNYRQGTGPFYYGKFNNIIINEGVTSVGSWAFYLALCNYMELPTTLSTISIDATFSCMGNAENPDSTLIVKCNIPEQSLGSEDWAYTNIFGRTKFVNVIIDSQVEKLGLGAFEYCDGIKNLTIENGVTDISGAFHCCKGLTDVVIPDSVERMQSAFLECTNLETITLPNNIMSIDTYAFSRCTKLRSITIPDTVTKIENGAFSNCSGLTSINIPDGVTSIDDYAFQGCSNIESITIPDGVSTIGRSAFSNCTNIKALTIPNSVTSIGTDAFKKVQHIYYNGAASGSPWGALAIN